VWSICTLAGGKGIADWQKEAGRRQTEQTEEQTTDSPLPATIWTALRRRIWETPCLPAAAARFRRASLFTAFPVEVCLQMTQFLFTTRSFESRSKSTLTAPYIFIILLPSCFILPSLAAHDRTMLILFSFLCTATPSLPRACISSDPETILF
jgi:hypothetical protein